MNHTCANANVPMVGRVLANRAEERAEIELVKRPEGAELLRMLYGHGTHTHQARITHQNEVVLHGREDEHYHEQRNNQSCKALAQICARSASVKRQAGCPRRPLRKSVGFPR